MILEFKKLVYLGGVVDEVVGSIFEFGFVKVMVVRESVVDVNSVFLVGFVVLEGSIDNSDVCFNVVLIWVVEGYGIFFSWFYE